MKFFNKKKQQPFKHLCPHNFNPTVSYNDIPRIFITPQAYKDMCALIDMVDTEVGWEGTVERIENSFLIKEIFLMEQMAHATTTIISTEGQSNLGMEIFDTKPVDEAIEILNQLRFWGHSHVNMPTNPSGQDDRQMDLFRTDGVNFFIRGIGNKHGRLEFTLYLYDMNIIIDDVPWFLYDAEINGENYKKWDKEITKKVTYKK
jgi:hypothetical protein